MTCPRCGRPIQAAEKTGYDGDGVTIVHWLVGQACETLAELPRGTEPIER